MAILRDGFQTFIFSATMGAGVLFLEKEVKPPNVSNGGPNDITTMRNVRARTRLPKKLVTPDKMSIKVAYDDLFYDTIMTNMGINSQWRVDFPDLNSLRFFGWLDDFAPDTVKEGEQPLADFTVELSNIDMTVGTNGTERLPIATLTIVIPPGYNV